MRRPRPVHRVRIWWRTRHWDDSHFPGCPLRYDNPGECIDPDLLCAEAYR